MKYYRPFSIVLLFALACANINLYMPAKPRIDKQLQPYVDTFLEYCNLYNTDCSKISKLSIRIVKIPDRNKLYRKLGLPAGTVVGQCWYRSNEVEISDEYYRISPPADIEALIIHELGHCVLDLEHTEDNSIDIMNPVMISARRYVDHYNGIINRFFRCKNNCPVLQYNESRYGEKK